MHPTKHHSAAITEVLLAGFDLDRCFPPVLFLTVALGK